MSYAVGWATWTPENPMKLTMVAVAVAASLAAAPAFARKSCEELKSEIEAKFKDKGVANYTLEIVANEGVADQQVVGSCDGGTRKIVYKRGG
jgi:hypothetical protein